MTGHDQAGAATWRTVRPGRSEPGEISDYALIGDVRTAGLVHLDGSIDWLCLPRFDSPACFAALLGTPEHGRWLLAPAAEHRTRRRYLDDTLVLCTEHRTATGTVRVLDALEPERCTAVLRLVEGVEGAVRMRMELTLRFDDGEVIPWMRRLDGTRTAVAGPDAVRFLCPVEAHGENFRTVAEFTVRAGERLGFELAWHPSHEPPPPPLDVAAGIEDAVGWWRTWVCRCRTTGRWGQAVRSSLRVLKALTHEPTGGIVAAPTTSLPEWPGGTRNWDYRYCWLRDAALTLSALLAGGYTAEAVAWRDWLLRAVAGHPRHIQVLYRVDGGRRIPEMEARWLPGWRGSGPVRIGNAAATQLQLDVPGEIVEVLHLTREAGIEPEPEAWAFQEALLEWLEGHWHRPDEGIWEVRGPRRHFTHSKVMCWVAFDRAARAVERWGLPGDARRWRALAETIRRDVLHHAVGADGVIGQAYDRPVPDAALAVIPLVGFLPADDPRVVATVDAIVDRLGDGPFVWRYEPDPDLDGLPEPEGAFLLCSFWVAEALALMGRTSEAIERMDALCGVANDVGLLPEQYDPANRRFLGNFPQAFSHTGLVRAALTIGACASGATGVSPAALVTGGLPDT